MRNLKRQILGSSNLRQAAAAVYKIKPVRQSVNDNGWGSQSVN